VSEKILLIL